MGGERWVIRVVKRLVYLCHFWSELDGQRTKRKTKRRRMQWCHWFALDLFVCLLVPSKHYKRSDKRHITSPFMHTAFDSAPSFFSVHPIRFHMSLRVLLWNGALFAWVCPVLLLSVSNASARFETQKWLFDNIDDPSITPGGCASRKLLFPHCAVLPAFLPEGSLM